MEVVIQTTPCAQDPGGRPSPAADVYSFGRVLFQVANGVAIRGGDVSSPVALHPNPGALNPKPRTLNCKTGTLNPNLAALDPKSGA